MRLRKELPKGFYDYSGYRAENIRVIINDFFQCCKKFGFQYCENSLVGFENTFLEFGTAAIGRGYQFEDNKGRKLMLCADSLSSMLRICCKHVATSDNNLRIMGRVQIFRYRRKAYRNWSHLIATMVNESNSLIAYNDLFLVANNFLSKYYGNITFEIYVYSIFETLFETYDIDKKVAFQLMHNKLVKKEVLDNFELDRIIETVLKSATNSDGSLLVLDNLLKVYPLLQDVINELRDLLNLLSRQGISYAIVWDNFKAIEYSSGVCFIVKDENNQIIADGGAYNRIVSELDEKIINCYSFACSLENILDKYNYLILDSNINSIYLIKLDCSSQFFAQVCAFYRAREVNVFPICSDKKLSKVLSNLPKNSKYIVIGKKEEENTEYMRGFE